MVMKHGLDYYSFQCPTKQWGVCACTNSRYQPLFQGLGMRLAAWGNLWPRFCECCYHKLQLYLQQKEFCECCYHKLQLYLQQKTWMVNSQQSINIEHTL